MIDLTGITNENEFYTHHYLSAILEEDLKKLYKEWAVKEKEEKERAPYSVLAGSAKKFFSLSNQLSNEKTEDSKKEFQNQITELILTPLGYSIKKEEFFLSDSEAIQLTLRINKPDSYPETGMYYGEIYL